MRAFAAFRILAWYSLSVQRVPSGGVRAEYQQQGNGRVTERVRLAIDVTSDSADLCRSMALRSGAVQTVDTASDATAQITDRPELAVKLGDAGIPVLLLNPLGIEYEICQRLAGSECAMPGHIARFRPAIAQVQSALETRKLGEPGLLRIHCWNPHSNLATLLRQELDLALWLFGHPPRTLYSVARPGYRQVHAGFTDGGMALIDVDAAPPGDSEYYTLSLIGSTGAAWSDDHHNMNLLMQSNGINAVPMTEANTAMAAMIDHFAVSLREGCPFSVNWTDTLMVLDLADRVDASAGQQSVVAGGSSHV